MPSLHVTLFHVSCLHLTSQFHLDFASTRLSSSQSQVLARQSQAQSVVSRHCLGTVFCNRGYQCSSHIILYSRVCCSTVSTCLLDVCGKATVPLVRLNQKATTSKLCKFFATGKGVVQVYHAQMTPVQRCIQCVKHALICLMMHCVASLEGKIWQ